MKAIRLVAACDEYDNTTPGFILKGCKSFDGLMADREGGLTAHDILEHQNGIAGMGPVWDELEACGGVWYVRGQWGDMLSLKGYGSAHNPAYRVASDVTRMFSEYSGEDREGTGPGGLAIGSRPHLCDDDFREIIEIARRDIPREYNDMGRGDPDEDENGWSPELHALCEEYLTLALHRMRSGFRKAQKRFERKQASCFAAQSLYIAIRDAVAQAVKHIDYEGQEFVLRYGNGDATCWEIYSLEEY